ncbi:MAG: hypothetical protein GY811_06815 [Myxococcales bacterium]|nr:hypothetical protein [Myxococcales bacterium]
MHRLLPSLPILVALSSLLLGCTGGSGEGDPDASNDGIDDASNNGIDSGGGGADANNAGNGLLDAGDVVLMDAASFADASPPVGGACNPVTQVGCQAGAKCAEVVVSEEPYLTQTTCVPDGTVTQGGACTKGAPGPSTGYSDCVAGYECIGGLCAEICTSAGGDTCRTPDQGFGEGGYCTIYANLFSDDIGLCTAACDPGDDSVAGGTVSNNDCAATEGCYLNVGREVASCASVPVSATDVTQDDDCYGPAAGSCYLNGCASGYSPILPDAVGQAASTNTCTRYCTPAETHTSSTGSAAGTQNKCSSSALSAAGSSTAGTHQCRFVQSLYGQPGLPDSVGMCVPTSTWSDCTTLDWDGINAAVTGASDPLAAFELFCYGVTDPPDDAPLDPECQGLVFGCIDYAAEQALFDLL